MKRASVATLDRFMVQCLEPLTNRDLEDIEYNKLARKARAHAWRAAYLVEGFWAAMHDAASNAEIIIDDFPEMSWSLFAEMKPATTGLRAFYWEKNAALLRTPAPDNDAVAWKKGRAKRMFVPMPREELLAIIAADEAFLAAHPVGRRRLGRAKAEG